MNFKLDGSWCGFSGIPNMFPHFDVVGLSRIFLLFSIASKRLRTNVTCTDCDVDEHIGHATENLFGNQTDRQTAATGGRKRMWILCTIHNIFISSHAFIQYSSLSMAFWLSCKFIVGTSECRQLSPVSIDLLSNVRGDHLDKWHRMGMR